jgi:N-methylhydantoinase A
MAALGRALGRRDAGAAAEAVVLLADARMEAALRKVSVERGHDPRDAALVAFGGAGGLHACALAESLGCPAVVFPAHAGVLSALGALAGAPRREASRTVLLDAADGAALGRAFAALEREVRRAFPARERRRVRLERWAEVRYRGQSHELSIPAGAGIADAFHAEHERRYGFADPGRAVEVVTLEVRGALPAPALPRPAARRGPRPRPLRRSPVRHQGRVLDVPHWRHEDLRAGDVVNGPALVLQPGATLWVAPGWRGRVGAEGHLVLARGRAR